jgi:hypothetical protein
MDDLSALLLERRELVERPLRAKAGFLVEFTFRAGKQIIGFDNALGN